MRNVFMLVAVVLLWGRGSSPMDTWEAEMDDLCATMAGFCEDEAITLFPLTGSIGGHSLDTGDDEGLVNADSPRMCTAQTCAYSLRDSCDKMGHEVFGQGVVEANVAGQHCELSTWAALVQTVRPEIEIAVKTDTMLCQRSESYALLRVAISTYHDFSLRLTDPTLYEAKYFIERFGQLLLGNESLLDPKGAVQRARKLAGDLWHLIDQARARRAAQQRNMLRSVGATQAQEMEEDDESYSSCLRD